MKKSLISIDSFSREEFEEIFALAFDIKKEPQKYSSSLKGKNVGLIFEKPSTRTRVSFEVGVTALGGTSFDFSTNSRLGQREPVKDVARTLSRYLDALVLRTFSHDTVTEMDRYASMPIINGLSDYSHPAQAMADYMTVIEKFGGRKDLKVAYFGDGNNVLNSLLKLFAIMGIDIYAATPKEYMPAPDVVRKALEYAEASGSKVVVTDNIGEAVRGANIIYTDVWISMGEEGSEKDMSAFEPYRVDSELVSEASDEVYVMHCLPAHRGEEVTEDVFESEKSVVFDQAENRLHAQKGLLRYILG